MQALLRGLRVHMTAREAIRLTVRRDAQGKEIVVGVYGFGCRRAGECQIHDVMVCCTPLAVSTSSK